MVELIAAIVFSLVVLLLTSYHSTLDRPSRIEWERILSRILPTHTDNLNQGNMERSSETPDFVIHFAKYCVVTNGNIPNSACGTSQYKDGKSEVVSMVTCEDCLNPYVSGEKQDFQKIKENNKEIRSGI